MYGKANTVERPSINKYISSVKYPISYVAETPEGTTTLNGTWVYSDWILTSGRDELSDKNNEAGSKYAKAINVIPNAYIKYTIKVSSNVSGTKTLKDVFNSDNFEFVAYNANNIDESSTNGWSLRTV
jgi:hypothetical protein